MSTTKTMNINIKLNKVNKRRGHETIQLSKVNANKFAKEMEK